jgi:hypothetical protein
MKTGDGKKNPKKLSKAQAKEQFLPLIEALCTTGGRVEVSDGGKVATVILSYKEYLWLRAQAREPFKPNRQLAGSGVLVGDLEKASEEITESILSSIEDSKRLL